MPLNPNGRPSADVVKPLANGMDITRRPRDIWIVGFGVNVSEADAALYEAPYEYVRTHVKPMRAASRSQQHDARWWLPLWSRPEMRSAVAQIYRYWSTPTVSKHRLFVWFTPEVLPNHALVVFARQDDYFFGVLHSRAHEAWSLRMGTWLEVGNDPRYAPTTCFETCPLPWPPGKEPWRDPMVHTIAEAAHDLNERRTTWLNPEGASEANLKKRTLTNRYNQRPTWLANLHTALDPPVLGGRSAQDGPLAYCCPSGAAEALGRDRSGAESVRGHVANRSALRT